VERNAHYDNDLAAIVSPNTPDFGAVDEELERANRRGADVQSVAVAELPER
jgi:hypothetical protein